MRIGVMLRSFDEQGGVGVYTRNLVRELLRIDDRNEYVFYYRDAANMGRFKGHANVRERVVPGANKAVWDQIAIPYACWQDKIDVALHPKFTVPLLAPCKAVMVVHGADWFIPEQAQYYHPLDIRYIRTVMPLYFKKASIVISVSQLTTDNFNRALRLPQGKVRTVYFGPARHFRRVTDERRLREVEEHYNLPDRFILTLSKRGGDARKNLGNLLKAYACYHDSTNKPHKLVIAGKDCDHFRADYRLPDDSYGSDILFPGWIAQEDLPAVYSLADLYLYPSNLEAFPIPITEAMACGTPIITSNVNGLREIAGEAAVLVDPTDTCAIAGAIIRVLGEPYLRQTLAVRGQQRSTLFTWDSCARETLEILEGAGSS